jgi:hypothetical protein
VNGATVKAAGALATEIDASGSNLKVGVAATRGAWTSRFALSGDGPITVTGTVTSPGPVIDATIQVFGRPFSIQGTPGKDLTLSVGPRHPAPRVLTLAQTAAAVTAPAPRTDSPQQVVIQDGTDWLRGAIGFTIVGWLLLLVAPGLRGRAQRATRSMPLSRFGMGIVLALDIPLAAIVLVLVGLPFGLWWVGIVGLVLFVALLIAAYAYAGFQLGVLLFDRLAGGRIVWFASVPLGVALLVLGGELPYIGGIISLLAVIYGLGSMLYAPRAAQPAAVPTPVELEPAAAAPLAAPASGKPLVE